MIPKITFEDGHYTCSEPSCCNDWGTRLLVNGKIIAEHTDINPSELRSVLAALGVECEIEEVAA